MKTKILFALMLTVVLARPVGAQWIQNISIQPANPTGNDVISIIVNSNFPSGDCDQSTQFVQVNGNYIDAYSIHCLGFATFICNDTDTFTVSPLPPGSYTFRIQLDMGGGPAPCTPGIIPVQTDSINFTVSPATGLGEHISNDEIMLIPNPSSDFISIKSNDESAFPFEIHIISLDGKKCGSFIVKGRSEMIDIRNLASGLYQAQLTGSDKRVHYLPLMINR